MKIVVTGGSGPLGTEVVRRLEGHGATVTSASRRTGVDLATGAGLRPHSIGRLRDPCCHSPAASSQSRLRRHPTHDQDLGESVRAPTCDLHLDRWL